VSEVDATAAVTFDDDGTDTTVLVNGVEVVELQNYTNGNVNIIFNQDLPPSDTLD
jgi:hypothetical protein